MQVKKYPKLNRKNLILPIISVLFIFLMLTGCSQSKSAIVIEPSAASMKLHIAGLSVEKRPIEYIILGKGKDVTLILSAIHGDEPAGTLLTRQLEKYLQQNPQLLNNRTVIIVPVVNPDGLARNSRTNTSGVDLNRNFKAINRQNNSQFGYIALSEPESRAVEKLLQRYHPDRIISIHQPYACIDYDGPAQSIAAAMAEYCDLPIRKIGAQPGSLGSYAGITLGIPIITLELPEDAHLLDEQTRWQKYGYALIAAIIYPEKIDRPHPPLNK